MHPFRFPRSRRLLKPSEFKQSHNEYKIRDRFFIVTAKAVNQDHARLGISVSRRVSLKAVVRNRIKRQIRETFRIHQHALNDLHVVVIARAASASAAKTNLADSLVKHWKQMAQLCRPS